MKLLSFGEILWDIIESKEYPGGAPFNLAAHAVRGGAQCGIVSCLGEDDRGQRALQEAERLGIDREFIQRSSEYPTGTVDALLSAGGQPEYTINAPAAYDYIELGDDVIDRIVGVGYDVFCFGTLAQRNEVSRASLMRLLGRLGKEATRVFCDINLRQDFYDAEILKGSLDGCDILKINDDEVVVLAGMLFDDGGMPTEDFCKRICAEFGIEEVVVTMGSKGAAVFDGRVFEKVAGEKVTVVDTIGAGDAFSAAFLCKRLTGSGPVEAVEYANRIGAMVASKAGAMPG